MSTAHHVDSALHPTPSQSPLVLNLQCINDFRLFQNQRKLISLQTWANTAIHKTLPTWAEKLKINQRTLIQNLVVPLSLKIIILIEWISCERHNDCSENPYATPNMYCFYNLQNFCSSATEKYFDHPALYWRGRYFSKSIMFYFYLLHLLEVKKAKILFETLTSKSSIYLKLHRVIKNVSFIPINQCIETPFIIDKHIAYCRFNDFDMNPSEELYSGNKHFYHCRTWQKLDLSRDLKCFSA